MKTSGAEGQQASHRGQNDPTIHSESFQKCNLCSKSRVGISSDTSIGLMHTIGPTGLEQTITRQQCLANPPSPPKRTRSVPYGRVHRIMPPSASPFGRADAPMVTHDRVSPFAKVLIVKQASELWLTSPPCGDDTQRDDRKPFPIPCVFASFASR